VVFFIGVIEMLKCDAAIPDDEARKMKSRERAHKRKNLKIWSGETPLLDDGKNRRLDDYEEE
jgi:hypothetical protein